VAAEGGAQDWQPRDCHVSIPNGLYARPSVRVCGCTHDRLRAMLHAQHVIATHFSANRSVLQNIMRESLHQSSSWSIGPVCSVLPMTVIVACVMLVCSSQRALNRQAAAAIRSRAIKHVWHSGRDYVGIHSRATSIMRHWWLRLDLWSATILKPDWNAFFR